MNILYIIDGEYSMLYKVNYFYYSSRPTKNSYSISINIVSELNSLQDRSNPSVNFDGSVNSSHEPKTSKESDGSSEDEECERNHCHVCEVEDGGNKSGDVQFRSEVPHRIKKQVQSR